MSVYRNNIFCIQFPIIKRLLWLRMTTTFLCGGKPGFEKLGVLTSIIVWWRVTSGKTMRAARIVALVEKRSKNKPEEGVPPCRRFPLIHLSQCRYRLQYTCRVTGDAPVCPQTAATWYTGLVGKPLTEVYYALTMLPMKTCTGKWYCITPVPTTWGKK